MPYVKKPLINYTNREFATIKEDLINYAQKYYPETLQDFNEASFWLFDDGYGFLYWRHVIFLYRLSSQ